MIKLVGLMNLKEGVNVSEFERHYAEVHVPLVKRLPGIKKYTRGLVRQSKRHQSPFYRMASVYFEDMDAFKRCLASPEYKEAVRDGEVLFASCKDYVEFICNEEEIPL